MKIISWNTNGIRSTIKQKNFFLLFENYDPDIVCLQETKSLQDQVEIDLPNYIEYWNSAQKKGYSGTAIFTKQKAINVLYNFPDHLVKKYKLSEDTYGNSNTEGRIIALEFKKFFLVTVYTPNAKDDLSRIPLRYKKWDIAFLEYMKELENKKPVIFCGDLNVAHTFDDLARPKENEGKKGFTKEERERFQNFIDHGFIDTFRLFTKGNEHYTWWSNWGGARARNVGWRIDYFLVSQNLKKNVVASKILADYMGSDHAPIFLEMKNI